MRACFGRLTRSSHKLKTLFFDMFSSFSSVMCTTAQGHSSLHAMPFELRNGLPLQSVLPPVISPGCTMRPCLWTVFITLPGVPTALGRPISLSELDVDDVAYLKRCFGVVADHADVIRGGNTASRSILYTGTCFLCSYCLQKLLVWRGDRYFRAGDPSFSARCAHAVRGPARPQSTQQYPGSYPTHRPGITD